MRPNISNVLCVIGAPLFGFTLAPRRSIAFRNSAGTWSRAPGKQLGVLDRWRDRHTRPARWSDALRIRPVRWRKWNRIPIDLARLADPIDCFTSHVGEHRTVRGLCKFPEEETPFVYITLATHVTLATAGYTPCLFGYVTIGLARHNRTHFSQSERLLVKPQRPCTDLCAEPAGVWNRL